MDVPSYCDTAVGRAKHTFHMVPAHEHLNTWVSDEPTTLEQLDNMVDNNSLPSAYYQHPIVQGHADNAWPVGLFIDGVPYSNTDSVIGFWLICEVTKRRCLLAALWKKLCCMCGCRGWCTYYAIFSFLFWCFDMMEKAVMPCGRHDNKPWLPSDYQRARSANKPLPRRALLLWVKGDWSEYSNTLGVPTWGDGMRPCFACNCNLETMYEQSDISAVTLPWRANNEGDYDNACSMCEIVVIIDAHTHKILLDALQYDRRAHGNKGRCLVAAVPSLCLNVGD